MTTGKYETGSRKLRSDHRPARTDQNAAMPRRPVPYGLTEPIDDVDEKTRHSDGANPNTTPSSRPGERRKGA